jgi:Flp pilus assembly protein TadG
MRGLNRAGPAEKRSVKAKLIAVRAFARLRSDEEGQAIVEAALMVGLVMIFMCSIVSFSLAIYDRILLTQAVNTGVYDMQQLQNQSGSTIINPCTQATTDMQQSLNQLDQSKLNVVFYENGAAVSGSSCGVTGNTSVEVVVSYTYSLGPYFPVSTMSVNSTLAVSSN